MKFKEVRCLVLGQASFNTTTERHQSPAHSPWARFLRPLAPEPLEMTVGSEHSRTRPPDRQSTSLGLWPRNLDFVKHTPRCSSSCCPLCLPHFPPRATAFLCRSAAACRTCQGGKAEKSPEWVQSVPHSRHRTLIIQALSDGTHQNVVNLFEARGDGTRVRIHVTLTQARMRPGPRRLSPWFQVCSQRPKYCSLLYFPKMTPTFLSSEPCPPPPMPEAWASSPCTRGPGAHLTRKTARVERSPGHRRQSSSLLITGHSLLEPSHHAGREPKVPGEAMRNVSATGPFRDAS